MRSVLAAVLVVLFAAHIVHAADEPTTKPSISRTLPDDRTLPELRFHANSLEDVFDFFRDMTGANIFVDFRALRDAGVPRNSTVTLQLKDQKLSAAINAVLEQVAQDDAGYGVSDGIIVISSTKGLESLWKAETQWRESTAAAGKFDKELPEVKFDNSSFSDTIDFLRQVSSLRISVDWATFEKARIAKDAPVSLRLRKVSALKILRLLVWQVGGPNMDIRVDKDVVTVAAKPPK